MKTLISIVGNPWILFTLSTLCFSLSIYVLTGMLVVWGFGFLVATIYRAVQIHCDRY